MTGHTDTPPPPLSCTYQCHSFWSPQQLQDSVCRPPECLVGSSWLGCLHPIKHMYMNKCRLNALICFSSCTIACINLSVSMIYHCMHLYIFFKEIGGLVKPEYKYTVTTDDTKNLNTLFLLLSNQTTTSVQNMISLQILIYGYSVTESLLTTLFCKHITIHTHTKTCQDSLAVIKLNSCF